MTRKEREAAIDIFEHNWTRIVNGDYTEEELNTAISKALEALKAEPCEDTISRKHLLLEIDELMQSPWFNNGKDDDRFTHYGYVERKEAVEIVRDLCVKAEPPVTPKQRWIPLAKGMPEKDGWYLVTERGKVELREWKRNKRFPNGSIGWQTNFCACVTAWMPLPEPYKEGVSE